MKDKRDQRGLFSTLKILTDDDFVDGAVFYKCYVSPHQTVPQSCVNLEPCQNALEVYYTGQEAGFRSINSKLENIHLNIQFIPAPDSPNASYSESHSFDGVDEFSHVSFQFSLHPQSEPYESVFTLYVTDIHECVFRGEVSELYFYSCALKDVVFEDIESREIRFEDCSIVASDLEDASLEQEDTGFLFYFKNCTFKETDINLELSAFSMCATNDTDVFQKYSTSPKHGGRGRWIYLSYFGDSLTKSLCPPPYRIRSAQDFDWSVTNAEIEDAKIALLDDSHINGASFKHSIVSKGGDEHMGLVFDFVESENDEALYGGPKRLGLRLKRLNRGLIHNTNFEASILNYVVVLLNNNSVTLKKEFPDIKEVSIHKVIPIFKKCNFRNALLGRIAATNDYNYELPAIRKGLWNAGGYDSVFKDLIAYRENALTWDFFFEDCDMEGCVSYYLDVSPYGGIFVGQDSKNENLDLSGRTLFLEFGENAEFRNMSFDNVKFLGANIIQNNTFINCSFKGADFEHAMFSKCEFVDCDFRGATAHNQIVFFKGKDAKSLDIRLDASLQVESQDENVLVLTSSKTV